LSTNEVKSTLQTPFLVDLTMNPLTFYLHL
jgi:hypothetical protein